MSNQFLQTCSHCAGDVKPGASFCMHCGVALNASVHPTHITPSPAPAMRTCPACHTQVAGTSTFCTQCGYDMRIAGSSQSIASSAFCTNCGKQNEASVRFCGGCGTQLGTSGQYSQYGTPSTAPSPYQDTPYPQYAQPYAGYQPQEQSRMVMRCPTCMAIAPVGTPNCISCKTSFAGIVPIPVNMPAQNQQGAGGLLQGNAGKYAMGALGGVAAVLGGEMLLHGVENSIEDRVKGDLGFGHHHHSEGLLGGLGELADDFGLF